MNSTTDLFLPGSGNSSGAFEIYFPCRTQPYSKHTISPFVWEILPDLDGARWYVVAVEAMLLAVGLTWNVFILLCYFRSPKLLKEPANIYLFNLAAVDILFLVFVTLTCLISEAAGEFIFGSSDFSRCIYCKFLGVVMLMMVSLSLHTLAAMSVDRCILLSQPMHYESIFNWRRALIILLLVWVISVVISVPPLFGFGDYEYNLVFAFCNARWTGGNGGIQNIYYILFFGLESMIPILVLIVMNVWIIKIVKTVLRERIVRQRTFRGSRSLADNEEMKYHKQQKQLMKVFGALFVAHIVCWVPVFTVMFIALGIGANRIPVEVFVACWLAFLTNPVVHPILETFFVKDLRYRVDSTRKTVNTSIRRAHGTLQHQLSSSSVLKTLNSKHFSSSSLNVPLSPTFKAPRRANTVSNLFATHNGVDSSCQKSSKSSESNVTGNKNVPLRHIVPRRANSSNLFVNHIAVNSSCQKTSKSYLTKNKKGNTVSFKVDDDKDLKESQNVLCEELEQKLVDILKVNNLEAERTEE